MTPIERFKVDEGVNAYGVRKTVHFDGDQVVSEFSYDAEPIIEQCKEERIVSAGERWGDGRKIGTLPPLSWRKCLPSRASKSARSSS